MVGKRDDKICNNALRHTQLAQPRSNNARITIGISRYVVCFLTDEIVHEPEWYTGTRRGTK